MSSPPACPPFAFLRTQALSVAKLDSTLGVAEVLESVAKRFSITRAQISADDQRALTELIEGLKPSKPSSSSGPRQAQGGEQQQKGNGRTGNGSNIVVSADVSVEEDSDDEDGEEALFGEDLEEAAEDEQQQQQQQQEEESAEEAPDTFTVGDGEDLGLSRQEIEQQRLLFEAFRHGDGMGRSRSVRASRSRETSARRRKAPDDDAKKSKKEKPKKRRKAQGGFASLCSLSPKLAEFLGVETATRPDVVKRINAYVKENGLQSPKDGRIILFDKPLQDVFGCKQTTFFKIQALLSKHVKPTHQTQG